MTDTPNITQVEIPFLPATFNFTDGHAHRKWTPPELKAVKRVVGNIESLTREDQPALEGAYLDALFAIGSKSRALESWICTSASQAIEIIANLLRLQSRRRVALVEPCFDNLADIFRRHDAILHPIPDDAYGSSDVYKQLPQDLDACCLVSPNNPTGSVLTREDLPLIVEHCEATGAVLIIDSCFRAFDPNDDVDLYSLLSTAKCDWAIIEDTGKTWPTLELKGPVLTVSPSIRDLAHRIHTDMTLHASPLTLALLTGILATNATGGLDEIRGLVRDNRDQLAKALGERYPITSAPFMSVAWVATEPLSGGEFTEALASQEVHVLPGRRFFWTDKGDVPLVRVALNRDREKFVEAALRIRRALS